MRIISCLAATLSLVTIAMSNSLAEGEKTVSPALRFTMNDLGGKPVDLAQFQGNFEKFLIGRNGEVVGRFNPRVKPDAAELVGAIEAELKKK